MLNDDSKAEYYRDRYPREHPMMEHHHGKLAKLLELIREDLRGELAAINEYASHMVEAMEAGYNDIARVLHHIMLDEKDHVASLTKILNKYDPEQRRAFMKEEPGTYSIQDQ